MRNSIQVLFVNIAQEPEIESWESPIVTVYRNREGEYLITEAMAFLEEARVQGIRDLESGKETSVSGRIEIVPARSRVRRRRVKGEDAR
ncbi:hypothetical protein H1P_4020003 [Hyella patelloides LEGE 07179]|uniref:Uncharacterized protein n=1 Tax=Hyella patelloides LEGE 07179 TaxID=945734 RepID=A0A563VXB8_9CYAN|nr:hypothetical protein [Hyella patelloides]VEP16092.1 hypothetical protein H1P_4020003 [Hyella patelloides LEGE 07179]